MVKWKKLDPSKVQDFCMDQYNRYKTFPSLRDIFYAFVGDLWPNTLSAYQSLSKWLRDLRLTGSINWRIIRDGSGREIAKGDISLVDPEEYSQYHITTFEEAPENYWLPKWLDQKFKVIVICEKEADFPVVSSILYDLNIDVAYLRGYSGWRLLFEIAEIIDEEKDKQPIVIALGDFDPSGEDIVRFVREALQNLVVEKEIKFFKIAITKEQVETFKLPHRPEDLKEIEKLQKDPRFKKWAYGLYRVETASLRVREPEFFEKILRESILKFFIPKIEAKVKEKEKENRVKIANTLEEWRREV